MIHNLFTTKRSFGSNIVALTESVLLTNSDPELFAELKNHIVSFFNPCGTNLNVDVPEVVYVLPDPWSSFGFC